MGTGLVIMLIVLGIILICGNSSHAGFAVAGVLGVGSQVLAITSVHASWNRAGIASSWLSHSARYCSACTPGQNLEKELSLHQYRCQVDEHRDQGPLPAWKVSQPPVSTLWSLKSEDLILKCAH